MQPSTNRNRSFRLSKTIGSTSMSNIQLPPSDKSKLSYHLKDFSFSQEASGLDLQGKGIKELDAIPPNFRELELLILDNNSLVDLQGVQQFQGLKQLSLINNQIVDILNMYHLRSLSLLEELDLRGNAIVTRPGYKETVLLFLKNIRLLDGKTIKASDRLKIPQQLSVQYGLLDRLVKNYAEILRLQSAIQKLEMFRELFHLNQNFVMAYILFDIDKFRRLFNYIEFIEEKTRNQFRGDLLADVRTIELEFLHKQDMQAAAQELLSRQSKNIAELTHRVKQKAQGLAALYSESYDKFDVYNQTHEEILLPSLLFPKSPFRKSFRRSVSPNKLGYHSTLGPETTVNNYFNFKNNPFDSVNQSTISLKSPVEVSQNKKSHFLSKPVHKHAMNEKLISPRKGGSPSKQGQLEGDYDLYATNRSQQTKELLSGYQKNLLETYQKQTSKTEEQPDYRRPKSPDDLIQYISPIAQSMSPTRNQNRYTASPKSAQINRSEEGLGIDGRPNQETGQILEEVITKKDWDSREGQRSQLSKNLDQKSEELSTINNINRDLKIKLKSLHEQNEIHLRLAKEEIEKANEDMVIAEQSRKQLEVEIARLKRNISEYSTTNVEIEKHKTRLQEEREYLKRYENELISIQILENRASEAYKQYEKKLQAKFFMLLINATDYSQRIKETALRKRLREERELLTTAFSMIKRNRIIGKIMRYKLSRMTFFLNQKYFSEWKSFAKQRKIETCLILKRQKEHLIKLFSGWLQYVEKRKSRNAIKEGIRDFSLEQLIKKAFKGLKRNFDLYGLGNKAEKYLSTTAYAKNIDWIKRSTFLKWMKWTREVSIPKKLAVNAAEDHYRTNLQRLALNLLKINFILFKDRYKKAEMLGLRRVLRTTETIFLSWKFDFRKIQMLKRQRKELADQFIQRKKYKIWREKFFTARRINYLTLNAQKFHETTCKKKCLSVFLEICEKGRASSKLEEVFVRKNNAVLLESLYHTWRDLFLKTLTDRKIARLEAIEIQSIAIKKWMAYTQKCREKKEKLIQAERLHSKTWQKIMRSAFKGFKENLLQRKKRRENIKRTLEKKKKRFYKRVFITLKELRMKELNKRYIKLIETHGQIKRESVETEDNISILDRERLDLGEKVDEVSEVTQGLREENERKKREIDRYEEIIKDKEKRQNKLEEELRKRRDKLDETENMSKDITVQLAVNVRNNERTLESMREEKEGYNNTIVQLLADMKEKDRSLVEVEQDNSSIREKKERYLKDSSQAIDDLKKEIRMVKEGADTKEQELRRAMELVQVLERRNQELRSQLHGTVVDLERSTLDFRSRIKTLEQKNLELLNETDKLKFENERRSKEIIEIGGTVKKYEYEIEYMRSGPNYRKAPRPKGSPLKSGKLNLTKEDVTFRDAKAGQNFYNTTENKDVRPSNVVGARSTEGVAELQDFLTEKRKILNQLDEKQDQIRKNAGLKEIKLEDFADEKKLALEQSGEEASKSQPAPPEESTRKVNQSKRKIEEIKRKLEDLKANKKDGEETIKQ